MPYPYACEPLSTEEADRLPNASEPPIERRFDPSDLPSMPD